MNEFIDKENNFIKNTDHFIVPRKHRFNWGYYVDLFEIIETEQAKEIPDAIRILEDRYQRAELAGVLNMQIQRSKQKLSAVIEGSAQSIEENITGTINQQNKVLENQMRRNANQLNQVQNTINKSTDCVSSALNNLNVFIDGLHTDTTTLNIGLDNF